MKKLLIAILLLNFGFVFAAENENKADEIIKQHLKARGYEKYQTFNDLVIAGFFNTEQFNIPFNFYYLKPNFFRFEYPIKGIPVKNIIRPDDEWTENMKTIVPIEPEEKVRMKNMFRIIVGPFVNYYDENKDYSVEYTEEVIINDRKAHRIEVKYDDGELNTHYIDADNFEIITSDLVYFIQGQNIPSYVTYNSYKVIDGYSFVWSYKLDIGDFQDTHEMKKIETNRQLTKPDFKK